MRALEVVGQIDERKQLVLDEALPIQGPSRVRVIILFDDEDMPEPLWLSTASTDPAFDFLKKPVEDIFTSADGKPFRDEG